MQFIKYPSLTNHYTARRQKFINFDDEVPDDMTFYKSHMTVVQKIKYSTLSDDVPWSQIWGYVKSRPTSVVSEVRDAIKLQFRNQSYYDII